MKTKNEINLKGNKLIGIRVEVFFYKDKKNIIADCPSLNIITFGKSLNEAKAAFKEAFELWIESANEGDFNARACLKTLGWKLEKSSAVAVSNRAAPNLPLVESNSAVVNNPFPAWCN